MIVLDKRIWIHKIERILNSPDEFADITLRTDLQRDSVEWRKLVEMINKYIVVILLEESKNSIEFREKH